MEFVVVRSPGGGMMKFDVMKAALLDELQKIAGAHVRAGRRPLKASTLLDKEKEVDGSKKLADMTKVAIKAIDAKTLGVAAVGAYGLHSAQKVKRRYDLGKQVEMQQKGGF